MHNEKIDNPENSQVTTPLMKEITATTTRRDIRKFLLWHKEDRFNQLESEELVNKLIKWEKFKYIFSYLKNLKISDYNELANRIINSWGWECLVSNLKIFEELNIKLDRSIADRLKKMWYWMQVIQHKNVFKSEEENPEEDVKWSFIVSPNDPRNFRW